MVRSNIESIPCFAGVWHCPSSEPSRASYEEKIRHYLATESRVSDAIRQAIEHHDVIRGMNKEQVILVLGQPEKVIGEEDDKEVWWYHTVKIPKYEYLHPMTWPWLLLHPHYLFSDSGDKREEIYWDEDRIVDLKYFGPINLP